jgi:hypothetical protein
MKGARTYRITKPADGHVFHRKSKMHVKMQSAGENYHMKCAQTNAMYLVANTNCKPKPL